MKKQTEALPTTAPNVHNGTYTVSHPQRGHFTVKLFTVLKGNLAGKRILSVLTGPDNQRDYTAVAFWDDEKKTAFCWRKFKGSYGVRLDGWHWQGPTSQDRSDPSALAPGEEHPMSKTEQKLAIWANLIVRSAGTYWAGEGYRLAVAGRCVRCNRELTDPVSIETGIGPKCGGRTR